MYSKDEAGQKARVKGRPRAGLEDKEQDSKEQYSKIESLSMKGSYLTISKAGSWL